MSSPPSMKRDNTMAVTAQEGEAYLASQGMQVTDDDVKTRAQKEKLEEITAEGTSDTANGIPKVTREGTMVATAKEGAELLDGQDLERTRGQTAAVQEAIEQSTSPDKPQMTRESTMAVTAQEGAALLAGEELEKTRGQTAAAASAATEQQEEPTTPTGKMKRTTTIAQTAEDSNYILGEEEFGRTRSQTRKISESGADEEAKKPAVKRTSTMAQTAKEGEEFLARESKRTKVDEENNAEPPAPEQQAEA